MKPRFFDFDFSYLGIFSSLAAEHPRWFLLDHFFFIFSCITGCTSNPPDIVVFSCFSMFRASQLSSLFLLLLLYSFLYFRESIHRSIYAFRCFFFVFQRMDLNISGKFSRNIQVVSKCIYLEGGHLRSHCPAERKSPQRRRLRELRPSNCSTQFCPPWQLRLFGSRIALKKIYSNTNLSE